MFLKLAYLSSKQKANICFKEAQKGFLTKRRMDTKIHANKLSTWKTRAMGSSECKL